MGSGLEEDALAMVRIRIAFAVQCSVLRFSRYATLDVVVVSGNGTVVENKVSVSARKRLRGSRRTQRLADALAAGPRQKNLEARVRDRPDLADYLGA